MVVFICIFAKVPTKNKMVGAFMQNNPQLIFFDNVPTKNKTNILTTT